ncbi:MAG: hypothetical protein ACRDPY_47200 [Streptosporangiaceae bacterium]
MPGKEIGFYLRPGVMTTPGRYQPLLADLPLGVAALAKVAQGLVIHEFLTARRLQRRPAPSRAGPRCALTGSGCGTAYRER